MDRILPFILATLTQHDRQKVVAGVDFEWSDKSWTHNFFRVLELVFWRKSGIRAEMSANPIRDENGHIVRIEYFCHTVESLFALGEQVVREWLSSFKLAPFKVYVPRLVTPEGFSIPASPFLFAIAFDTAASNDGGIATTNTYAITCTGSNLTLTAGAVVAQSPRPTATATYNSVSMTAGVTNSSVAFTNIYIFYLVNPATGSHNVVTTASASARNYGGAISMSGTNSTQTGATSTGTGTGTTPSLSVTTNTNNSWVVNTVQFNNTLAALSPTATGTNQTSRYQVDHVAGGTSNVGSTQTTTTAGSYTSSWSLSTSDNYGMACLEILANPTVTNSGFLMFM